MDNANGSKQSIDKMRILNRCHELILKWARISFSGFISAIDEHLYALAERAPSNDERARHLQSRDELQCGQDAVLTALTHYIHQAFIRYQYGRSTVQTFSPDDHDPAPLSLVDNTQFEQQLAISSMSHKASNHSSETLYVLNRRFSALALGHKLNDLNSPVAPGVFAEALQQGLNQLQLEERARLVIYKVFDSQFMSKLPKLYEMLNRYCESQQVLPDLSRLLQSGRRGSQEIEPAIQRTEVNEQSAAAQQQLIQAIIDLLRNIQPPQPPAPAPSTEQVLQKLQQLQQRGAAAAAKINSNTSLNISAVRNAMDQATQHTNGVMDHQLIDVVGLLFDFMLKDEHLPDSVKTLLSYLHTSYIKLAIQDRNFFDHPQHPARQLLNQLVAAGQNWVDSGHNNQDNEVFIEIRNVVQQILNSPDNDPRLFTELALSFGQFIRQQARRVKLTEQRAMQAAAGEHKLNMIRDRVKHYLDQRLAGLNLPEPVIRLLYEPWANYLSFNLLRYGSKSAHWQEAAGIIDRLIKSLGPATDIGDKKRETDRQLRIEISEALTSIGFDPAQGKQLLEALHQHQQAASSGAAIPVSDAGGLASNIDVDTINIGPDPSKATQDDILDQVKNLTPGQLVEFNSPEHPTTAIVGRLAWSNPETLQLMFVNRLGQQLFVKNAVELSNEIASSNAKILATLDNKPFFEQALGRILQQLSDRGYPINENP